MSIEEQKAPLLLTLERVKYNINRFKYKHEKNINEINQLIQNKPCVIIVGSFKKINNANRLAKTLTRKKYKVYREPYLDFHRVGVQFDCLKKDLQTVLSELKTTFNPDCWILKY